LKCNFLVLWSLNKHLRLSPRILVFFGVSYRLYLRYTLSFFVETCYNIWDIANILLIIVLIISFIDPPTNRFRIEKCAISYNFSNKRYSHIEFWLALVNTRHGQINYLDTKKMSSFRGSYLDPTTHCWQKRKVLSRDPVTLKLFTCTRYPRFGVKGEILCFICFYSYSISAVAVL